VLWYIIPRVSCPVCGGSDRRPVAPGYWKCRSIVVTKRPGRGGALEPVWHDAVCGAEYQEGVPAGAGTPVCACGTFAIGLCDGCAQPLCGIHGGMDFGKRRCSSCVAAARRAVAAATAAGHAVPWFPDPTGRFAERRRDGSSWSNRVRWFDDLGSIPTARAAEDPVPLPISGWYDDPISEVRWRYWDGASWTNRIAKSSGGVTSENRDVSQSFELLEVIPSSLPIEACERCADANGARCTRCGVFICAGHSHPFEAGRLCGKCFRVVPVVSASERQSISAPGRFVMDLERYPCGRRPTIRATWKVLSGSDQWSRPCSGICEGARDQTAIQIAVGHNARWMAYQSSRRIRIPGL
jgi:hypothetical protein